jgi:hypothetical protein
MLKWAKSTNAAHTRAGISFSIPFEFCVQFRLNLFSIWFEF